MNFLKFVYILCLRFTLGYVNNINEKIYERMKDLHPIMKEFSTYTTIKPEIYQNEQLIRNLLDIKYNSDNPFITLNLHLNGERISIALKRRNDLIQLQNINTKTDYITHNTEVTTCHYQGSIRLKPKSNVSLSICTGTINANIFDGIETYFIYPGDAHNLQDKHLLFRNLDSIKNKNKLKSKSLRSKWSERKITSNNELFIAPYNANKHSSYIEFLIVVDNSLYNYFGSNVEKIHQHCKNLTNIVNAIYAQLNIFVVLVNVIIWNKYDEINISTNGRETLDNFLSYRKTKLLANYPHDHAQLLTLNIFDENVVGKAILNGICSSTLSGAVCVDDIQAINYDIGSVASTMAHEMGHNFGLPHDTEYCNCGAKKCVMSTTTSSEMQWSNCSLEYINNALARKMNYCMQNKPNPSFNAPNCGNGFLEAGEQCDCGLPEYCFNTCCDAHTCLLRTNATCATGECCDLKNCNLKLTGSICRDAKNQCDLPEYCTGDSEFCPLDVFKRDLELCDDKLAYCYQGKCQTHKSQCQLLWGTASENSHSKCYERNFEGSIHGNCGYDRLKNVYRACEKGDELCGSLFCQHLTEKPEIGTSLITISSSHYGIYNRSAFTCNNTLIDFGLNINDPGLTPNGAKCGENKMCLNQKCITIESLLASGMGKLCSNNCSGNGVCNNRGNCHCDIGFGGENCRLPGPGGSVDSGPATNTQSKTSFQRFMLIFFCSAVPCAALCILLLCYCHHNNSPAILPKFPVKNQRNLTDSNEVPTVLVARLINDNTKIINNEDCQSIKKCENIANSTSDIDYSTSTEHVIKVIDLKKDRTITTIRTKPKTINLSDSVINKKLILNAKSCENITKPTLKMKEKNLQLTTKEKTESALKRHSKSCENL